MSEKHGEDAVDDRAASHAARRRLPSLGGWGIAVPVTTVLAGLLFVTSAVNSEGSDLRTDNVDLPTLVEQRTQKVAAEQQTVDDLAEQVQALTEQVDTAEVATQRRESRRLRAGAGFTEVTGAGIRIALTDAPRDVEVPGLDPNLLVVHQQDIQAFVNALWDGGAKAVTLQGQRLISTTGIKCVGNTVILEGVPYSPPYVIEAVGDTGAFESAMARSAAVQSYRDYADRYQLGLATSYKTEVVAPAYQGTVDLRYAKRAR